MLSLTRRYTFSAGHRLCRPEWSTARNTAVYGQCANPPGHGHNYIIFITITGELNQETGMLMDLSVLDNVVKEKILFHLDHHFLNNQIEFFKKIAPTSENLCRYIWNILRPQLKPAKLVRVKLMETENNFFEYCGD